ncbi:MAG: hypothetical protein JWQ35_1364 [Bacteriovoracaceae bacterium]|nr:hypothetical protein [Bacteriovoracaceae bacterium]
MFKGLFSSGSSAPSSGGAAKELESLLEKMIIALVDEPNDIKLEQVGSTDELVSFELRVAKSDLGKVIGKKGRTASAMRTILSAASRKHRVGSDLRIVE